MFAWRWQVWRTQSMCKCFYGLKCSIYSIMMGIVSKKKKKRKSHCFPNHLFLSFVCVIQTSQLLIVAICPNSGSLHWKFMFESEQVQIISFSQLFLFMLKCSRFSGLSSLCISVVNPIFSTSGHFVKNNFVFNQNEKEKNVNTDHDLLP